VTIFVIGLIVMGLYSAGHWFWGVATGHSAEHAALLEDARSGVVAAEADLKRIRIHASLKKERMENGKWVYAGENETTATYIGGSGGEGKVDCVKDVAPNTEGGGFYRREFQASYLQGVGKTLITRQGGMADGPADGDVVAVIENRRPAWMERCDEGTGWAGVVFGKWPNCGEDGLKFSDFLAGKREGVKLLATPDHVRELPTIRVRAESPDGRIDLYWLDMNSDYSLIRWEEHTGAGKEERVVQAWEVKSFMHTPAGHYYPERVEGERREADGSVSSRWQLDVDHIWVNEKDDEKLLLKVPAGKVLVREEGEAERVLDGSADGNSLAVNGNWSAPREVP
jgi:hypothetical protein